MARHVGPRADSAAHKVICRLVDLGGTANAATLMEVVGVEFRSVWRFRIKVIEVLEQHSLAIIRDGIFKATPMGKDYVAEFKARALPITPKYVGEIVPARTAPPARPLSLKYLTDFPMRDGALIDNHTGRRFYAVFPMRDGAFAHRDIPSLMGGKRILPNGEIVE